MYEGLNYIYPHFSQLEDSKSERWMAKGLSLKHLHISQILKVVCKKHDRSFEEPYNGFLMWIQYPLDLVHNLQDLLHFQGKILYEC